MKRIPEISRKLSLKEKIETTLYILKSLRSCEENKKYSPIKFSDLEMIFLFHAFYFNVYDDYYNEKVAIEIEKLFDRNSKNLNQISELVKKVNFRKKLSSQFKSNFDDSETDEKHIEKNSWHHYFPSEKDGEDFYYSYIFDGLQQKIGTRWNNVLMAYHLIRIFVIPNDNKKSSESDTTETLMEYFERVQNVVSSTSDGTDEVKHSFEVNHNTEVPKEYKKVLKEVIECFNQFSNPITTSKTENSREYKHSLEIEMKYSIILKNLFVNTKDCEIYSGSFSDRFNYSFLEENNKFSTSLFYNQIIDQEKNNAPLRIINNSYLTSSLLYLSLRYIYQDKSSNEKLSHQLNLNKIPIDKYLSENKKDIIILNDNDLFELVKKTDDQNRDLKTYLSSHYISRNSRSEYFKSLDFKKYLNKGGKLILFIDPRNWFRSKKNPLFDKSIKGKHIRSVISDIDLSNNNRLISLDKSDRLIIELTYDKNEKINFFDINEVGGDLVKILNNYNEPKNQISPSKINNFNSYFQKSIDYNKISEIDDLNPKFQLFDINNSVSLKNLVKENEISRNRTPDKKSKIISLKLPTLSDIRNLTLDNISFEKNGQINWFLNDFNKSKYDDFNSIRFEKLIPGSLLITGQFSGGNLKIGYFNPSDKSVDYYFIKDLGNRSRNIQLSLIDENYDPEYIILEFGKPYVLEQIKRFSRGGFYNSFDLDLINKLRIVDLGLAEQKSIVDSFYNSINKFSELKIDKALEEESKVAIWDEFHHDINAPLSDINSYIRLIKKIDFKNFNDAFAKIQEYANFIESDIYSIKKQLKLTDELINLTDKAINKISLNILLEKLKSIISKYNNLSKFSSEISMFENSDFNDMIEAEHDDILNYVTQHTMDETKIVFNEKLMLFGDEMLFEKMINNILRNTELYAYEKKDANNKVFISVDYLHELNKNSDSEHFMIIEFSNNGKPFKKNYTKESFVRLNKKSEKGTGSGGAYINEIARKFNNPGWEFITFPNKKTNEVAVIYRFKFKLYE